MKATFINKSFWSRAAAIFMIVMLVLAAMPIQSARADMAGFSVPTIYSNSALLNTGNAYASDNLYAQSTGSNKSAEYGNFGFSIPAGSTINLVEVSVESKGNKNWRVSVSKNNGASYSAYTTITNTATDLTTVTGGPGTLWGLTNWTAASLNDANFRVKINSATGNPKNIAYLDQVMVKVTYSLPSSIPTTLVMTAPSAGTYGGTVNLVATLKVTSSNAPLSGKTIAFTLDGYPKGTAVTNASGVATLSGVSLTTGLSGTLLNAGTYNVSATFVGDTNYAFSSDTKSQVVNQRAITVTADAKGKAYGTSDPTLTYTFAPALIGTDAFSGALSRVAGESVGTHAIIQGTLALSPNYIITYVGANLTITPLGITVTADNKAVHTGEIVPAFTFGVSNFVSGDAFVTAPACGVSGSYAVPGTYPIVCAGGDAGANYTITYNNGTLTVTDKFVLTVTADAKSVTYGSADPAFTFAYTGFVDGDTGITGTAPACGVAGPHANVGSYPSIVCSGGLDDKYEFSYTSATLTVNPLAVTVTANSQGKTYGAADPALTYGVVPALISGDSFSGALVRAVGENVAAYAISQGNLALNANYTLSYVSANLTISKAPLTVNPDDQSMGIGAADPLFTFDYTGLMNNEDSGVINTPPTCSVPAPHSLVGTYAIVCANGVDNNYSFVYVNGVLTVVQNQIDAYVTGNYMGSYFLNSTQGFRDSFQGVNSGPVKVVSANTAPFLDSMRVLFGGVSYSELMGFPNSQLTTDYWFPYYNNVAMDSQLRVSNVGGSSTTITVTYGNNIPLDSYTLAAGAATRKNYAGINSGPLHVTSSASNILATVRVLYGGKSYSELMGFPNNQLTTNYWFPYYNNVAMDSQLRVSNVGGVSTTITVTYGNNIPLDSYTLAAGAATRKNYAGINSGPLHVTSSASNILTTIRVLYGAQSYSEIAGFPANQLTTEYWYPVYDNVTLDSQLRVSNVGGISTVITVYGVNNSIIDTYTLAAGEATRKNYPTVNNGPLHVVSSASHILSTQRLLYTTPSFGSFYEMTGFPDDQLTTQYWFPWYNNVAMDSQIRIAVP